MGNNPKWLIIIDDVIESRKDSGQSERKLADGIKVLEDFKRRLLRGQVLTAAQANVLLQNVKWHTPAWWKLLEWVQPIRLTSDQIYNATKRSAGKTAQQLGAGALTGTDIYGPKTGSARAENGPVTGPKRGENGKCAVFTSDLNELRALDMRRRDGRREDESGIPPIAGDMPAGGYASTPPASISTPAARSIASPSSHSGVISSGSPLGTCIDITPEASTHRPAAHPMASPTASAHPLDTGSGCVAALCTQPDISNDEMGTAWPHRGIPLDGSSSEDGFGNHDHEVVKVEAGALNSEPADARKLPETPKLTQQSHDVRPALSLDGCRSATASIWFDKKTGQPSGNLDIGDAKYKLAFKDYEFAVDGTMKADPNGADKQWRALVHQVFGRDLNARKAQAVIGCWGSEILYGASALQDKEAGFIARVIVFAQWNEATLTGLSLVVGEDLAEIPLKPFQAKKAGGPDLKGTWRFS